MTRKSFAAGRRDTMVGPVTDASETRPTTSRASVVLPPPGRPEVSLLSGGTPDAISSTSAEALRPASAARALRAIPLPVDLSRFLLPPQDSFVSVQKWEGVVLETSKDEFVARLVDLAHAEPDYEAEFPLEEVSEEDRPLVQEGAVFYWNIGYRVTPQGQREGVQLMRFRRLPAWTARELRDAEAEAERLARELGWT